MLEPRGYPFDKEVADLFAEDLEGLRQVHEGWYVEYKEEAISPRNIAKSLSAFANQYGGWLFFGIAEDRDNHTAGSFPGIPAVSVQNTLDSIRNASKDLVRPFVFYEQKVIDGPVLSISLPENHSIIVVRVPQGPDTPYLHNDGRVYRRVGDASDPRHITDRSELDLLSARREEALTRLQTRVERSPITSQTERDTPHLHLHILSDPYEILGHRYSNGFAHFAGVMNGQMIPFENVFPSNEGYVARQIGSNDPYFRVLTWEFSLRCHSLISVPIRVLSKDTLNSRRVQYSTIDDFGRLVERIGLDPIKVLDLDQMLKLLWTVSVRHRLLVGQANVKGPFYVKCRLENVWRTTPYLDVPEFVEHAKSHGLPLIQEMDIPVPPGSTLESFIRLDEREPPKSEKFDSVEGLEGPARDVLQIGSYIFAALGLLPSFIELCANKIAQNGSD